MSEVNLKIQYKLAGNADSELTFHQIYYKIKIIISAGIKRRASMKRIIFFSFIFLVLMSYGLTTVVNTSGSHDLSMQEKFALELKACKEAQASGNPGKCGLYGKIQYVTSFPDVKVQVVTSFPDIKVQIVSSFADGPGEWEIVNSFPDYKVQVVDSFPDYKIQYVTSFPGCN